MNIRNLTIAVQPTPPDPALATVIEAVNERPNYHRASLTRSCIRFNHHRCLKTLEPPTPIHPESADRSREVNGPSSAEGLL